MLGSRVTVEFTGQGSGVTRLGEPRVTGERKIAEGGGVRGGRYVIIILSGNPGVLYNELNKPQACFQFGYQKILVTAKHLPDA